LFQVDQMPDDGSNAISQGTSPNGDMAAGNVQASSGSKAEVVDPSISIEEHPAPMLDVHPPHEGIHSWTGFWIHIATITIGTVEFVHHRQQAREMTDRLREESRENHTVAQFDIAETEEAIRAIRANMHELEVIRDGSDKAPFVPTALPAGFLYAPSDTAWIMMRDSALLPVVPNSLVQNYWKIEAILAALDRRKWEAERSRYNLDALLHIADKPAVLSPQRRESLQIAFSEHNEILSRYRATLVAFDVQNDMALSNKVITIKTSRDAMAHSGLEN